MNSVFEITETEEHGTFLRVNDVNLADELDDFLTEECYVLFEQRLEPDHVVIQFGQASSSDKVRALIERFERKGRIES